MNHRNALNNVNSVGILSLALNANAVCNEMCEEGGAGSLKGLEISGNSLHRAGGDTLLANNAPRSGKS